MNRAERRRRERAKNSILVVGDGIIAAGLGQKYEATGRAPLPKKVPGKHRWVAVASWVLDDLTVEKANDPNTLKFMDNENLMSLSIGCWDCEEPLGKINPLTFCPAKGED
jgi:hypothetical protein